ncbi:hypothetical protein [Thermus tenuipuniceus]|nr:hypothetical protein [Thermus tenuipuniceus]
MAPGPSDLEEVEDPLDLEGYRRRVEASPFPEAFLGLLRVHAFLQRLTS